MEATLLALVGGAVALYCLWQFRRWLAEGELSSGAGPRRLEVLVDELLTTAEATSSVVQEKAEALAEAIAEADKRIAALKAPAAAAPAGAEQPDEAAPEPAVPTITLPLPEPGPAAVAEPGVPVLHRDVYALADAGQDLTTIARTLGLTKGEVQLILGLRQTVR
ncbi:MAG TPA: hypothetical protein VK464_16660 [Symbiobacteriaceae bacterium]|nr:hypothetical protein [Symbiobacteriaceae bacterium]